MDKEKPKNQDNVDQELEELSPGSLLKDNSLMLTFSPAIRMSILMMIFVISFCTRIFSVIRFESIIHEFDPWFNYRATRFLSERGRKDFYYWFDTESWYPLGRFVGFTAFPGLMYTTVVISKVLDLLLIPIDIRHVCVFCAPLFSMITCYSAYALTGEITGRPDSGLFAALFIAVIPSYISRSAAGSYDNEAISITLLLTSFYLFLKAVNTGSMFWSALSALCYAYLVASWGGYSFVITFVPVFVLGAILTKKFNAKVYVAYSTFYVLANIWSVQTKYIEFRIWQSSEHLGSHFVFILVQVMFIYGQAKRLLGTEQLRFLGRKIAMMASGVMVVGLLYLAYSGKTKFTERVMTLLDPSYAKSFMPIVASVSEHQPTSWATFFFDTHFTLLFAPVGLYYCLRHTTLPKLFIAFYLVSSIYFASLMIRLLLVVAPALCILAGIGVSELIRHFMKPCIDIQNSNQAVEATTRPKNNAPAAAPVQAPKSWLDKILTYGFALFAIALVGVMCLKFMLHGSVVGAEIYSSPSVILANRDYTKGDKFIIDDFREAFYWIRKNTPTDAKIFSWWDYGYQLAGFTNRTTLVDNNTWNHTHIAQIGRIFASTEEGAYDLLDSLDVDYVLVVFGGKTGYSGDDINKFLWILRIAANEYPHLKEADFTQNGYAIDHRISPAFKNSIMYKLSYYRFWEDNAGRGFGFDAVRNSVMGYTNYKLKHFEEVFTSQRWLVRIFRRKKKNNREDIAHLSRSFETSPINLQSTTDDYLYTD
jgi:dolichyl-diphosphooligosaccharide--protein glycosyltransferase